MLHLNRKLRVTNFLLRKIPSARKILLSGNQALDFIEFTGFSGEVFIEFVWMHCHTGKQRRQSL